jgi:hypothetical protein
MAPFKALELAEDGIRTKRQRTPIAIKSVAAKNLTDGKKEAATPKAMKNIAATSPIRDALGSYSINDSIAKKRQISAQKNDRIVKMPTSKKSRDGCMAVY